jgi:hypothetical protein
MLFGALLLPSHTLALFDLEESTLRMPESDREYDPWCADPALTKGAGSGLLLGRGYN